MNYELFKLSGNDTFTFLKGQTTNTITLDNAHPFLNCISDRSGKVRAVFHLIIKDNVYYCLVSHIFSSYLQEHFQKFIIMEDIKVEKVAFKWHFDKIQGGLPFIFYGDLRFLKFEEGKIDSTINHIENFIQDDQEISNELFVNTYLNDFAFNKDKGCFLGQEHIGKINAHKGPSFKIVQLISKHIFNVKEKISVGGEVVGQIIATESKFVGNRYIAKIKRKYAVNGMKLSIDGVSENLIVQFRPETVAKSLKDYSEKLYHKALASHMESDDLNKCVELLELAFVLDEESCKIIESLGVFYGKLSQYSKAIKFMDLLEKKDPLSIMAHTNKSLFYMKINEIEKAEHEKAMATTKSFKYHANLAKEKKKNVELESKRRLENKNKKEMFLKVLEIDSEDHLANYGLGTIYLDEKNLEQAKKHLSRAMNVNKKHSMTYLKLAQTLIDSRDLSAAKSVLEEGVKIAGQNGDLMPASTMQGYLNDFY